MISQRVLLTLGARNMRHAERDGHDRYGFSTVKSALALAPLSGFTS